MKSHATVNDISSFSFFLNFFFKIFWIINTCIYNCKTTEDLLLDVYTSHEVTKI